MITIVALICSMSVCHEEIVARAEMPICFLSPSAIVQWKQQSRFSGPQWTLGRVRCEGENYQAKHST